MAKERKISDEEHQFEAWLEEAMRHELVLSYSNQPHFELIGKQSVNGKHLHREHVYTADFRVRLSARGERVLHGVFQKSRVTGFPSGLLFVDTKGSFMNRGTGQEFSINQKLVYERHGVWVAKVVPYYKVKGVAKGLFVDTWCPEAYRWVKKRKVPTLTTKGSACRTVEEFMKTEGGAE